MTKIIRYTLVFAITVCLAFTAQAQKFGYVNSQAILMELPDVKRADAKLEALQTQYQKKGQQMLESYQTKRADLDKRYQEGTVSQVQAESELKVLGEEEKKIMNYEQEMVKQISTRREELIKPILNDVQEAIDAVAKEKGYQYIFDTGSGVLLYARPEDDITEAVKAKIGM